jgi:FKBP-type peptidyl-prolyl cis-trans isomerase
VGQHLTVHYIGSLAGGEQFDANGPSDTPFSFQLGAGEVIAGWEQGLLGAKIGTNRQLIIPPALGYGTLDLGVIPPNSILVFSVLIVSAQ